MPSSKQSARLAQTLDPNPSVMLQFFRHLQRPLPGHFRTRQNKTKEWFYTQSKGLFF